MGLTMPQKEFSISLRFSLAIPLFPSNMDGIETLFLWAIVNSFADHLLDCGHNNLRILRHGALSDVLAIPRFDCQHVNCRKEQRCIAAIVAQYQVTFYHPSCNT